MDVNRPNRRRSDDYPDTAKEFQEQLPRYQHGKAFRDVSASFREARGEKCPPRWEAGMAIR
jgi:hypothetical protein